MKIGRNDLCWCGSGKKFKKCHLDREHQAPVSVQEQLMARKLSYQKHLCLHPQAGAECEGNIIHAHTIQRNGSLSKIAQNGHVYTFSPDHSTIVKGGSTEARLVGLNKASTFTGFCGFHDDQLFAPIEKYPFSICEEHTFLLGYRAICKEFYGKSAQLELIPSSRTIDKGKSLDEQLSYQEMMNDWMLGLEDGMKWLGYYKSWYEKILINTDFSDIRYYVIELESTPDFMCSGAILPDYDFQGKILQTFIDTRPQDSLGNNIGTELFDQNKIYDAMTFTVMATENGGVVVFSWLGESKACKQLVNSLDQIVESEMSYAVVRFAFNYFWNIFACPVWWDALDNTFKDNLLRRQREGGLADALNTRCLIDDGIRAVSWHVKSRVSNVRI